MQALGATLNVMALLLVNMIGYAVGIKGAGHVAGGIFLDREGQLAVAYSFMFVFSGVQVSDFGTDSSSCRYGSKSCRIFLGLSSEIATTWESRNCPPLPRPRASAPFRPGAYKIGRHGRRLEGVLVAPCPHSNLISSYDGLGKLLQG